MLNAEFPTKRSDEAVAIFRGLAWAVWLEAWCMAYHNASQICIRGKRSKSDAPGIRNRSCPQPPSLVFMSSSRYNTQVRPPHRIQTSVHHVAQHSQPSHQAPFTASSPTGNASPLPSSVPLGRISCRTSVAPTNIVEFDVPFPLVYIVYINHLLITASNVNHHL